MSRSSTNTRGRTVAIFMALGLASMTAQVIGTPAALAASGDITTVAGDGNAGYSGDGGQATAAELNGPILTALDSAGNLYISDIGNNVVREVSTAGVITTVAGNGTDGFSGDGGAATSAQLSSPFGLAFDGAGNLLIADAGNQRIREVSPGGTITTLAGDGNAGFSGDGGPATAAEFILPIQVLPIAGGGFYVADYGNDRVRKVDGSGTITTVAGGASHNGTTTGSAGDGGPATAAQLGRPLGLALDEAGDLYIAQTDAYDPDNRVRMVDPFGTITTVAGAGAPSFGGDGGPATAAFLNNPYDLAYRSGNLFISDYANNRVRMVDAAGTISTVAGDGTAAFGGDGGPATAAQLNGPTGLASAPNGDLFVVDNANNRVRQIAQVPVPSDLVFLKMAATSQPGVSQPLTYSISVTDPGTVGPATGVTVTDTLPPGVSFGSATASQGSCTPSGGTVNCALGALAAGATATVTINVTTPPQSTTLTNTATVAANEGDPQPGDNSATATTLVGPADVSVALEASTSEDQAGAPFTYTATVTDNSTNAATGVMLSDPLPAGLTFNSATTSQGSCSAAGGVVTCALGDLASGASATVTITVTPSTYGSPTNSVTVSSTSVDPSPDNNTASVQVTVLAAGCGQTITKSTTLKADIGPCPGHGVVIGADNITLNLNGHRIFGFGTGADFSTDEGTFAGVVVRQRIGVTVKGGTVSGFDGGVEIEAGGKNTVTGMTVRDNIGNANNTARGPNHSFEDVTLGDGIVVGNSAANTITSNTVIHNGPFDGIGVLGLDANSNLVQNNTVQNTVADPSHVGGVGIAVSAAFLSYESRQLPISHNDVIGNTVSGNAGSGISSQSNLSATITNNRVTGNGLTSTPGNGIDVGALSGYNPNTQDVLKGNRVDGSGADGIQVSSRGNQIRNNVTGGDNALHGSWFDLHDTNTDAQGQPSCVSNVWSGNSWGTAGFFPACTSMSGRKV